MKFYSQKDPLWRDKQLGFGKSTIGQAGCAITSIANKVVYDGGNLTPLNINQIAKDSKAFSGDMLTFGILAKALGYNYSKVFQAPEDTCVAETNHYLKVGYPQHFFLYDAAENARIDPLDLNPQWEHNDYNIVSYRVFKSRQIPVNVDIKEPTQTAPVSPPITPPLTPEPIPVENAPTPTPTPKNYPSQPIIQPDGAVTTPEPNMNEKKQLNNPPDILDRLWAWFKSLFNY